MSKITRYRGDHISFKRIWNKYDDGVEQDKDQFNDKAVIHGTIRCDCA